MDGGIEHVARAQVIALGMDIEIQLEKQKGPGFQPVLYMLRDARERAIAAMTQLTLIDPADQIGIRKLQLEIMLFDDMVSSCKRAVERGRETERVVADEDREAIHDIIMNDPKWANSEILSGATEVNDQ